MHGRNTSFPALRTPDLGRSTRIGEQRYPIDHQNRLAADTNVAVVRQDGNYISDEFDRKILSVFLFDQDLILLALQMLRPVFVGPTDTKRKIWLSPLKESIKWALRKVAPIEPVVVEAEAEDPKSTS